MNTPQTQAKAIVAGIVAALLAGIGALGTVITGDETLSSVTLAQWLFIAASVITALGSTYGITWSVTNAPPKAAARNTDGSYVVTSLPAPAYGVTASVEPLVPPTADQIINGTADSPATGPASSPQAVFSADGAAVSPASPTAQAGSEPSAS